MPYQYELDRNDYSFFASGSVFYHVSGQPALPVRLTSEVFQRCLVFLRNPKQPITLYDPCCGGAYHLSVLAYRHWKDIGAIIASDIDPDALSLAERNLSLLTKQGLDQRIAEIEKMIARYGKESHAQARESARALRQQQAQLLQDHEIKTELFLADVTDRQSMVKRMGAKAVDLVIADVPYGWSSSWQTPVPPQDDLPTGWRMLESLRSILGPASVAAIIADKGQKFGHEDYRRLDKFRIGRRQIWIFQCVSSGRDA